MEIVIYSKEDCVFCAKAKEFMATLKSEYTEYKLNRDFDREEIHMRFPEAKTFPVITIDGKYIGGYNELLLKFDAKGS